MTSIRAGASRFARWRRGVVRGFDPRWTPRTSGHRTALVFRCSFRTERDPAFAQLTDAGCDGHAERWDAFCSSDMPLCMIRMSRQSIYLLRFAQSPIEDDKIGDMPFVAPHPFDLPRGDLIACPFGRLRQCLRSGMVDRSCCRPIRDRQVCYDGLLRTVIADSCYRPVVTESICWRHGVLRPGWQRRTT